MCGYRVDDDKVDDIRYPINELSCEFKVLQKLLEINSLHCQASSCKKV